MSNEIRLTIWNEYRHEKTSKEAAAVYPKGIHEALADFFRKQEGITVRTAVLDDPEHGLTDEVIETTDVLIWWGHKAHDEVDDAIVEKLHRRVQEGMGFIPLHSAHYSKLFKKLMGTGCRLRWREKGEKERLWVVEPSHPIVDGIDRFIDIPHAEMYGERFDIPAPDTTLFISWYQGGEVFRSGCCFYRNKGKIFYFKPGHETYPIFYQPEILKVIKNAVHWAMPVISPDSDFGEAEPLETL